MFGCFLCHVSGGGAGDILGDIQGSAGKMGRRHAFGSAVFPALQPVIMSVDEQKLAPTAQSKVQKSTIIKVYARLAVRNSRIDDLSIIMNIGS